ncbi:uncharacterized protein LOC120261128 [Dioscorea cayenensis subsp. rotundata]|uniref:Uncharacterized protein LOC120261128 n=1 Tax=Dioscorea cayennensis subsp. rotundata TaxID=55577 RepID=A0AB40BBZ5_DIOCR|nr:uncharacterized protein LOC120261128 [Dioscorea cayenensis subsp. rotundata]
MAVSFSNTGILTASTPRRRHRHKLISRRAMASVTEEVEIRVCVNRSCGRQGSREILEAISGLAPHDLAVASCGCLGRCGAGPNLVVLPPGSIVSHCGTATRAAQLLADLLGPKFDAERNLEALAMRKMGEKELEMKNFSEAVVLFSQAIDLEPSGGCHLIYRSRSVARLAMGDNAGALDDAEEAANIAPKYPQAYLSQGDAYMAMEKWTAAEKAYLNALLIDPSIRRSKSFKARIAKLQEKLVALEAA